MTLTESQNPEDIIKELCMGNGLWYEKIDQEGPKTVTLEMFFSGYPCMVGLSFFPNLTKLVLVGQNIQQIACLESCPSLRELWVAECNLTRIDGLQHCKNLEKLYLYCNDIHFIENLESLTKLEALWLNNNQIQSIKGLHTLQNLKELNLAGNVINKIGNVFDPNEKLETLNLSGNRISSLKELTNLARLLHLKDLGLNDPQYGANPVCLLCNYATHVLYHMPHLQRLDTYDVDQKSIKDLAEARVLKKIIYYNMRVKNLCRQLNEKLSDLEEERSKQQQIPKRQIKILYFAVKNLEKELGELQNTDSIQNNLTQCISQLEKESEDLSEFANTPENAAQDSSLEKQLCQKVKFLNERIQFWTRKLDEMDAIHQKDVAKRKESTDLLFQFLLIELETVGNVRFEEGTPVDPWFNSCCDLILSRFCAWEFKTFGITGVKINRIIRVHNRILRQRFDDKFQIILDNGDERFLGNYRKLLEYLFCVFDPELPVGKNKLLKILEDGFKESEKDKMQAKEDTVLLSNSLNLCDGHQKKMSQLQTKKEGTNANDYEPSRPGWLVVAKTFLGRCVKACDKRPISQLNYPMAHSVFRPRKNPPCVTNGDKNDNTNDKKTENLQNSKETCSSLELGNCDCSLRQCEWFVFDHDLVLPEYVIELEYIALRKPHFLLSTMTKANADERSDELEKSVLSFQVKNDDNILNMEPVIKPKPKIIFLDEKIILSVAKTSLPSHIEVLNLHGNGLNKLRDLSKFSGIKKLIISFNEFTSLEDVSYLPNLEYLDASHNRVITLEGFKGLAKMKHLDLSWNQLKKTEEIQFLYKNTAHLLTLYLENNPWQKPALVRLTAIGRLRTLTCLDGVPVTEHEAAAAVCLTSGPRISQGLLLLHSRTDEVKPRCLTLLPAAQILTQISSNKLDPLMDFENSCFLKHLSAFVVCLDPVRQWELKVLTPREHLQNGITTLNLDGQNLSKLTNLEKLENLRWASFCSNFLSNLDGLENCLNLEELALDDNCITQLDGLSNLTKLIRLSVNNNQLTGVDRQVIDSVPHLHFLSVESNCISSMSGFQKAYSLIELYIGNNRICSSQEIYHLKHLNNLVILDLHGNLISRIQDSYRLFVIFHLPSLKALDGIAVELAESENAKDAFGGRLTSDMIAEKLGHANFSDMHEISWTTSTIRTVDLVPSDQFTNVHTVNLEHNSLTSFSGLIFLPNIKILCLDHNHIESIITRPKPQNQLTNRQILHLKVTSSGYGQQTLLKGAREAGSNEMLPPLMTSLEVLHLSYNGISNLPQLQLGRLQNLKSLFLQGNEINQVEGIEGLQDLKKLVLDHNRIKVITETSFAKQGALLELHLEENRLRDINNLDHLQQLKKLFIGFNKIQEMSELEKLESLPSMSELTVYGNPVSRKMLHRPLLLVRLQRLQVLDGIPVSAEERTRAELHYMEQQMFPVGAAPLEVTLPGSTSVLTRPPAVRVMNMNMYGAMPHIIGSDLVFPHPQDDFPANEVNKQRKSKFHTVAGMANNPRSLHAEIAYRQLRGGPSISQTYLPQQSGLQTTSHTQPNNQEADSRLANSENARPSGT